MGKQWGLFLLALVILVGMFGFVFEYTNAQTPEEALKLSELERQGLVPCGTSKTKPCELCDIFKLAKNVTDGIVYLGFFVATAAVGIGGFMIMIGGAVPQTLEQGKKAMTAGIIGLLIILFAWFIVDLSIKVMVGNVDVKSIITTGGGAGGFQNIGPWNSFQCEKFNL